MLKISLIITAKNESTGLSSLFESIAKQTRKPDEVVLAIAGSDCRYQSTDYSKKVDVKILELHQGANRAVGRNTAIEAAKYEHILITDAGCVLKETWVEEMDKGFAEADVVAGFYKGEYTNVFEKCELPYVLVMPDKIDRKAFLPATRSMGITKDVWKRAGKFNETYRFAEDYEFARRIQRLGIPIKVVPEAIVYWRPRKNLWSFACMIYEHAYGDAYSGTFRPKVPTIYLRYVVFCSIGAWHGTYGIGLFLLYLAYAVQKNYRYVQDLRALLILPTLQIVSDFAVMWGNARGVSHSLIHSGEK